MTIILNENNYLYRNYIIIHAALQLVFERKSKRYNNEHVANLVSTNITKQNTTKKRKKLKNINNVLQLKNTRIEIKGEINNGMERKKNFLKEIFI